ncbi:MAG: hypothetical protein ACRDLL_11305 [Solirubrobacterales bacterium]
MTTQLFDAQSVALLAAIERLADDGGVLASTGTVPLRAAELAERHTISAYDVAYAAVAGDADIAWSAATSVTWSRRVSRHLPKTPAHHRTGQPKKLERFAVDADGRGTVASGHAAESR